MKINVMRWKAQTCDCISDYSYDADLPPNLQVRTGVNLVSICPIHAAKAQELNQDPKLVHVLLEEEHTRKNWSIGKLLEALPPELKKAPYEFNDGEEPKWSFDQDRNVTLEVNPKHKAYLSDAQILTVADPKIDDTKIEFK